MSIFNKNLITLAVGFTLLTACSSEKLEQINASLDNSTASEAQSYAGKVDLLITNGSVYTGESKRWKKIRLCLEQPEG